MSTLAEIQDAILHLDREEQERLRIWLDGRALDLDEDSPELEAALVRAVQDSHAPLVKDELEAIAQRALVEHRDRRSA
jgi:hypothetical protein